MGALNFTPVGDNEKSIKGELTCFRAIFDPDGEGWPFIYRSWEGLSYSLQMVIPVSGEAAMNSFNWDSFWEKKGENKQMIRGAKRMANRIGKFLNRYDIKSVADFGCGSGGTLFILADKYPHISFYGFDSSLIIVSKNHQRAEEVGLSNLCFKQDTIPLIKSRMIFDLVYSIATLHYVMDIKRAIQNLYRRVNTGGFLIFNYPNRYSMFWYRNHIKPSDKEMRVRFSLLLAGQNLITLKDITITAGKKPKNFWRAVGENGQRANVCVYLHKPCTPD